MCVLMIQTISLAKYSIAISQMGCIEKPVADPHDLGRLCLF